MNKLIKLFHRWLGFPIGIVFFITFATGVITVVDELINRYEHNADGVNYTYTEQSNEDVAEAVTHITENHTNVFRILLPTEEQPFYYALGRGERWRYAIDEFDQAIDAQTSTDGFFSTVLNLHRNLLLGRDKILVLSGSEIVTWVGLIALLLSLIGLWIWWPLRKSFKLKDLIPQGKKRKHFYYNHMTAGVVVCVVIVMLALTGASVTYRDFTKELLNISDKNAVPFETITLENHWYHWIDQAQAQMPEGAKLAKVYLPRPARKRPVPNHSESQPQPGATKQQPPKTYQLIFKTEADWLGVANNKVYVEKSEQAAVISKVKASHQLTTSERLLPLFVPLHTGRRMPTYYVVILLVLSTLGSIMTFSGVWSFLTKNRKKKAKQKTVIKPTDTHVTLNS